MTLGGCVRAWVGALLCARVVKGVKSCVASEWLLLWVCWLQPEGCFNLRGAVWITVYRPVHRVTERGGVFAGVWACGSDDSGERGQAATCDLPVQF